MTANKPATTADWFRRLIMPPRFANDAAKTRTAQFLNAILLASIALLGVRLLTGIFYPQELIQDIPLGGLLLVMGVLLLLMRTGRVRAASIGVVGAILVVMTAMAFRDQGIHDGAFFVLTALVVMASLLLGWKASAAVAALCIAVDWVLASRYFGVSQVLGPDSAMNYALNTSVVFILIVVLMYLITNSLWRTLEQSKIDAQSLQQRNIELNQLRTDLEERVATRTAQLNTSVEIGRVAASFQDPQEMLDEIVTMIAERFTFYYVAVFTLNNQGDSAILRAATGEAGRRLKEGAHKLPLSVDSMVGYAILKRRPRIALDVGKDAVRFANPLLPETRSEIALPLLAGDTVLGALDVQSEQEAAFDEATSAMLQSMVNQLATALFNAYSFERVQKSLEYTKRQFAVGQALFAAKNPEEAYIALGQAWALLSHIERLQIYLVAARDVSGRPSEYELAMEWDVIAGVQVTPGQIAAAADLPLINLGRFDRMVVISDINDPHISRTARTTLLEAGIQSLLLVPLRIRDQFEGMLIASAEIPTDFSEAELNLITAITDQLAVVLNSLRLATDMQATVQRMELLNRRLSGEAWQRYIALQPELEVDSGRPPLAIQASRAELPIRVRGQAIGTFALEDVNPDRQWNPDELTLFQVIVNEVALAIDNARLIEQTQRTAQREKDIARAADKIHRASDLDEILRTAVYEISRIVGVTDVAVQIGTETPQNNGQSV